MVEAKNSVLKKAALILFASFVSLGVILPASNAKADIPTYYPVPEPSGGWKLDKVMYYQTPNTSNAYAFAAGVAGYIAGNLKGKGTAALASGLVSLWSSKIKGKTAYITAKCYYKENSYIRRTKVVYTTPYILIKSEPKK